MYFFLKNKGIIIKKNSLTIDGYFSGIFCPCCLVHHVLCQKIVIKKVIAFTTSKNKSGPKLDPWGTLLDAV